MQTTLQRNELSVAILMDDLSSAKELAVALRHNDILAYHYQSLDEFWAATSLELPDLVIVDVTKMSQGSIQFRAHPRVADGTLSYAFYSKDTTKILLQSTFGLSPIGYLHQDASLNAQVMGLVKMRTAELLRKQQIDELEKRVHRLQSRSQRLISERSSAEEFRAQFEFIRSLCQEIEEQGSRQDFTTSLMNKLDSWEAIEAYGFFELNQNGQKLVSPEVSRRKHHPFPSLWLGQVNAQGIEKFAQDMGEQVAKDLFETEPVCLRIHSGSMNPDILLYVSFSEERMQNFPWGVLESLLSSSYRRLKIHQQMPQYSAQFIPMWEALDLMDKMQISGVENDLRIVCLSLVPLTDVAKRRTQNKFYWSSFFNDFFLQLSGRLQKSTQLSLMGPWQVIFFIPRDHVETETQMLQNFIRQFGFWKFFEDNSDVLSEEMKPVLKLMPASSAHYFRLFEKEFEDLARVAEGKRLLTGTGRESRKLTL